MTFYSAALLFLATLTAFTIVHADSTVFSQFIGDTTISIPGTASGFLAISYTECSNILHELPPLTSLSPSVSTQLEQEAVDAVCLACASLGQSRVDSCCGQASSSACFDQFSGSHANNAQTTPASVSATLTATAAGGATAQSSANGGVVAKNKDLVAGPLLAAVVGVAGWVL